MRAPLWVRLWRGYLHCRTRRVHRGNTTSHLGRVQSPQGLKDNGRCLFSARLSDALASSLEHRRSDHTPSTLLLTRTFSIVDTRLAACSTSRRWSSGSALTLDAALSSPSSTQAQGPASPPAVLSASFASRTIPRSGEHCSLRDQPTFKRLAPHADTSARMSLSFERNGGCINKRSSSPVARARVAAIGAAVAAADATKPRTTGVRGRAVVRGRRRDNVVPDKDRASRSAIARATTARRAVRSVLVPAPLPAAAQPDDSWTSMRYCGQTSLLGAELSLRQAADLGLTDGVAQWFVAQHRERCRAHAHFRGIRGAGFSQVRTKQAPALRQETNACLGAALGGVPFRSLAATRRAAVNAATLEGPKSFAVSGSVRKESRPRKT